LIQVEGTAVMRSDSIAEGIWSESSSVTVGSSGLGAAIAAVAKRRVARVLYCMVKSGIKMDFFLVDRKGKISDRVGWESLYTPL
jgi:hypothetical protein